MCIKNCVTHFTLKRVKESLLVLPEVVNNNNRHYSFCCPPRKPPGGGGCTKAGSAGSRISPPANCRPSDIPSNPCCPQFHHGKDTWKKFKYFAFFVCFPIIILQTLRVSGHEPHQKSECRDYEFMRIRTKRFPWGDGRATLFHNDHVNHLPGECEPPPLDCD